jgi:hypothetical protein
MTKRSWHALGASSMRKCEDVTAHGPMTRHALIVKHRGYDEQDGVLPVCNIYRLSKHHEHHEHHEPQQPTQYRY